MIVMCKMSMLLAFGVLMMQCAGSRQENLIEESNFGKLITKQMNAELVSDKTKYQWIARIVVTPDDTAPVICTAACYEERIFITAATCLLNAKVYYTRVYYQDQALQPLAFVLPSKPTKAMFNDVGLIVVNENFTKPWKTLKTSSELKPSKDIESFMWHFETRDWWNVTVVGYVGEVSEREYSPNEPNNIKYLLYQLDTIYLSTLLCNYLYNPHPPSDKFFVPCYSACNVDEHNQNLTKCYDYLAGEGHMVVGRISNSLIGIATWGGHYEKGINKPPLPVGVATPNSDAFIEDLECARKIAKAPEDSERFDIFCQ